MEKEIIFEQISKLKTGVGTLFHYGTFRFKEKEFDFTLVEMAGENSSEFAVTWIDKTPENKEEIEKSIISTFEAEADKA